MKWLENFTLVMRSSVTQLREKVENPERMIHQLIIDMEEEIVHVRDSVAEAIADELQMTARAEDTRADATRWQRRAQESMAHGDEASAKAALGQKIATEERQRELETRLAAQKLETGRLQRAVGDLEEKIRLARQRKTLLLARLSTADSRARIDRALERAGEKSAFAQFRRLEDKVERAEAKEKAYRRMEGHSVEAEDLEEAFRKREADERLERELNAMREQKGDADVR